MAPQNKKNDEEKPVETAEAKIHCDEAAGHLKNGNYTKALTSYNLVIISILLSMTNMLL